MRWLGFTLVVLLIACAVMVAAGLAFGGDRLTW